MKTRRRDWWEVFWALIVVLLLVAISTEGFHRWAG